MSRKSKTIGFLALFIVALAILLTGCGGNKSIPTVLPTALPTARPTATKVLPIITAVTLDRSELPRYESLEMTVSLKAQYSNPYDLRQIRLDGVFTGPDEK